MIVLKLSAAAIALGIAVGAGSAQASPAAFVPGFDADGASAIAPAASLRCYPRLRWTYRPGLGLRLVPVGKICFPILARPFRVPDPGPLSPPVGRVPRGQAY